MFSEIIFKVVSMYVHGCHNGHVFPKKGNHGFSSMYGHVVILVMLFPRNISKGYKRYEMVISQKSCYFSMHGHGNVFLEKFFIVFGMY